jgi:hypothetical protein
MVPASLVELSCARAAAAAGRGRCQHIKVEYHVNKMTSIDVPSEICEITCVTTTKSDEPAGGPKAEVAAAADPILCCLEQWVLFVPRSIREPFVGDLLEDQAQMRRSGASVRRRWAAVALQILALGIAAIVSRWFRAR